MLIGIPKEIKDHELNSFFNEEEKLKLIYNYNLNNETNMDIQVLQNHNQDQIIVVNTNINTNEQTTKKEDIWFPHWDFVNRDEIVNIINKDNKPEDIKNVSINLEENVYFLPNIFSNINTVNDSEILFVYLPNLNIILIIPGYMVIYFYKKYIIFNTNINIINEVTIDEKRIKETKETIKNLSFIKILHKIPDYKITDENNAAIIISCFLLYKNIELLSSEQREMYNEYKSKEVRPESKNAGAESKLPVALSNNSEESNLKVPSDTKVWNLVPENVGDSVCVATALKFPIVLMLVAIIVSLADKLPDLSTALIK